MLRSKVGEVSALRNLPNQSKDRIAPVIHVAKNPPAGFVEGMVGTKKKAGVWVGRRVAVDGRFNFTAKNSAVELTTMLKELGDGGVLVIPSVKCGAPAAYVAAITPFIGKYDAGLVLKVALGDLPSCLAWVGARGWKPSEIDLVIDLEHIAEYEPTAIAKVTAQECAQHIGKNHQWRSVALSSAAFPRDFGGLKLGRNEVTRLDWTLWNSVRKSVPFSLDYGDYGIAHPNLEEPPDKARGKGTISVRYTADKYWIAIKGKQTGKKTGMKMHPQYLAHSKLLIKDAEFGGINPCWGDDQIRQIPSGKVSPGSPAKWVEYSLNRHLSLVLDRLP